ITRATNAGYLLNAASTAQDDNILKGTATVLVIPELEADSSTTWYLADTTKPVKPFIFQQRRMPNRIDVMNKPTDPNVFSDRVVKV
ncbi:Mu-like prophage major head subunit gpT family protein, partial [Streptococcus pneumoniae]